MVFCLASFTNGNHDKVKEITHWVYFLIKQRKSRTKKIWQSNFVDAVSPPGCTLTNIISRPETKRLVYLRLANSEEENENEEEEKTFEVH